MTKNFPAPAARIACYASRPAIDRPADFIAGDPTGTSYAWIVVTRTAGGFETGNASLVIWDCPNPAEDGPDYPGSTRALVFEPGLAFGGLDPRGTHMSASFFAKAWLDAAGFAKPPRRAA